MSLEQQADYHVHTVYAGHAHEDATVANMIYAAEAQGLNAVVILEHVPEISGERNTIELWREGRDDRWALDQITREIEAAAEHFPDLRILRGVEVDADPFALDGSLMLEDLSGLDVVLGSTHVLPGGPAFWFAQHPVTREEAPSMAQVWRDWAVRLVRGGRIHILAHPGDLLGARQLLPPFSSPETLAFLDPLLEALAETGVAFELNESLHNKFPAPYRDSYPQWVRRAREAGVRFSLGSDAHREADVGRFHWTVQLMQEAGIAEEHLWRIP